MYRVEGKNRFELSRRVNFDMAFERPLFVQEYQLIYSEGEDKAKAKFNFYNGNKLEGKMTPITMLFQREDYLMIMRCLYFNIQYDDTMDKMFYLDYETIVRNQSLPGSKSLFNKII